jgi:hypothetical protein
MTIAVGTKCWRCTRFPTRRELFQPESRYFSLKEGAVKKLHFVSLLALLFLIAGTLLVARPAKPGKTPAAVHVHMVVTAESQREEDPPLVAPQDVMVYQGHDRDEVTGLVPLRDQQAALELFVLLDDATQTSVGSQLQDLRQFIAERPSSTLVGVAYMRDGTIDIRQDLTNDHTQAAKAVRLPLGYVSAVSSPYLSLVDLVKRWPEHGVRREVLMVGDGIDRFGGTGPVNPYVDSAVEQAQRAGVIVYAIYLTGVGQFGRSFWRLNWGQNYLSELAEETGGDAYFQGYSTPVSLSPFLDQLNRRLNNQYRLEFLAKAQKKEGLQPVKVRTEDRKIEIVAATRVWVPAAE